jgi:hypothetical protein
MPRPDDIDHAWPVRVRRTPEGETRVYARDRSFDIGSQASLRPSDPEPSALEYALGALGGDLICGFEREARARAIAIHAAELSLSGRLDNVLVHLGVVGEEGHPGIRAIDGKLYVETEVAEAKVDAAWRAALARSPLFNTLIRCARVSIDLCVVP